MYQFTYAVGADGRWRLTSPFPTAAQIREQPGIFNKYRQIKDQERMGMPANRQPMWLQIEMGVAAPPTQNPTTAVPGSGAQTGVPGAGAQPWAPPGGAPPAMNAMTTPQEAVAAIMRYWGASVGNSGTTRPYEALQSVMRNIDPTSQLAQQLTRDTAWVRNAYQSGYRGVALPTWYQQTQTVTTPTGGVVTQPGPSTGTPGANVPIPMAPPAMPGSGTTPVVGPPVTPIPPLPVAPGPVTPIGTPGPVPVLPPVTTQPVPPPVAPPTSTTPALPPVTGTPSWPETPNTPQLPWIPEYPSGTGPNYPIFFPTIESNPNPWAGLTAEQMQRALAYYSGMLPYAELAEASRRYDTSQQWTQRAEAAALTGRQQLPNTQRMRRFY